jgi:uncharacterized protein
MTIEYLPVGIACNIACKYCYQETQRDAGNINVPRNWDRVKLQLDRMNHDFAVFGGEPLLAPMAHLEEVFKYGFEKYKKNGIQTNGSLITDEHIEMFAKYAVHVGISIDGPGELNSVRCTNDLTAKTELAIKKLCDRGIPPSLILTIHRGNNDIPRLTRWLDGLATIGLRFLNFHEMEQECGQEAEALPEAENIRNFLQLYEWSKGTKFWINPFVDIRSLLTEMEPRANCVWHSCDPQTTEAVQGINPDGSMSNCGRAYKDGVNWLKADTPGYERYVALYHTPQEHGGCAGCKYFAFCKGQCPGTAIGGDWRNRSLECRLWYSLFDAIAADNRDKLLPPDIVKKKEEELMWRFAAPQNMEHGDKHGDSPHGDGHGDHTDYGPGVEAVFLDEKPEWLLTS